MTSIHNYLFSIEEVLIDGEEYFSVGKAGYNAYR